MAERFIGLQMLVTLRSPPSRITGTVTGVQAGAGLTLSNVWYLDTNKYEPRVTIPSDNIAGITDFKPPTDPSPYGVPPVMNAPAPAPAPIHPALSAVPPYLHSYLPPPQIGHVAPAPFIPQTAPSSQVPAALPSFVDPAILEMGRRPSSSQTAKHEFETQGHASIDGNKTMLPGAVLASDGPRNATPVATGLPEAVKSLKIEEPQEVTEESTEEYIPEVSLPESQAAAQKKKRNRRTKQGGGVRKGVNDELEASPQPTRMPKAAGRGKGWRQTPMLQSTASFQPFNALKKNKKGAPVNDNGWASEDVTDIQEMGDFDFEEGINKFDKQNLFEQLRKDDKVDEADRLVTHNRQPRPKPGTAGGKNLHYSENVLDVPSTLNKPTLKETQADFWNSEADDGALNGGGERLSGRELAMGSRQGSRRGESKVSTTRRSQSRKASAAVGGGGAGVGVGAAGAGLGPSRVNSGVSLPARPRRHRGGRKHRSRASNGDAQPLSKGGVVDSKKQLSSNPSGAGPTLTSSAPAAQHGLFLLPSNRRVEPVSPLQMLNLENIAHNDVGLTEDMMTENAGRGIAETTLTVLRDPAIQVRHAGTADPASGVVPPPTIVVLAGNNKSGIRSVAAARHLRNRGSNVLVCLVGLERGERDLLEDMRQQIRLYKNLGGRVLTKTDLFEHIRKLSVPTLTIDTPRSSSLASLANPAPVTLIIDALLGLAISFEELRTGDQATTYELIEWANRNEAFVLAVDVPSGIDPSSGKVSVVDGGRLYIKPRYVVAIGAPKRGLVDALAAADAAAADDEAETVVDATLTDDSALEWKLFLADMGLGAAVWKKAGTKIRRGIDFDDKWVVEMKYMGAAYDVDEVA